MQRSLKRVVVTGMGAITPLGNNVADFWSNLCAGKSGAAPITLFDTELFKTKFACEVKNFDPEAYIDKKLVKRMDRFSQFAMASAKEAVEDGGLLAEGLNRDRIGIIWGTGIGGLISFQNEVASFGENGRNPRFTPFFITRMLADMGAGLISMEYGFRGVNFATVSACASSTNAIIDAFNYIRLGKADVMLAGGSEAAVCEAGVGGFSSMKALSQRNDAPEKASRPFDADRDGFVLGEGGGTLILEELEHAQARGAHIYAEVLGGGCAADAYHMTAPHPEGKGVILAVQAALEDAGISPEQVDYINTHATSTPAGDLPELNAMGEVFGPAMAKISISATKSMTGHLLGAAGVVEAMTCIKAINDGIVPPTINLENRDPEINPDWDLTPNVARKRRVDIAMSNTFGFGGHNAIGVFGRFTG
ncbi:MAG: beta-ketoacyl-ACP synthase II [Calditrichaeota bacterium]|nr:beta-ketoacyl-ACP synthase II [Calditrichota bacterium]